MTGKTQRGLQILAAAGIAGVFGDGLLRVGPPGINVFLWAAVLVVLVLMVTRAQPVVSRGDDAAGALALLVFAAGFAWRDSLILRLLDFGALGIVVSLAALRTPVAKLAASGLFEYAKSSVLASFRAAFGGLSLLFDDIKWSETVRVGWPRRVLRVACGTVLAVPPLIVFGALLMAADNVFRRIVVNAFFFNIPNVISHIFLIGFLAWIVGGTLRGIAHEKESFLPEVNRPRLFTLGITELGVVLGLLDILFLAFVAVQLRYFFGGASLVNIVPGLSYAEYARHGFFELCAVSALVLPLLLGAHWLLRPEKPAHETIFRALAGFQVLLVFVIMASAAQRMRLYEQVYGLTELRVYTMAFMAWLALVFVWFALTVLRGHRRRFAFGAMVAGFAGILALNALNPDALIARTNIARAATWARFDVEYVSNLSDDSIPTIIRSLPGLDPIYRCTIARHLLKRRSLTEPMDWRTWNWSRAQAREAFQSGENNLRLLPCTQGKELIQ